MKKVRVNLGRRSYDIHIGEGALEKLNSCKDARALRQPIFVVTDKRINTLHGKKLKEQLKAPGKKILFHEVPGSEKAKSFSVYMKTIRELSRFARKAKPLLVAFGGGVVGDLTGFIAATYRRGVPYVNIPTTLLAQVDSAIGGKVAIDIKKAKNIVGNFYQPKMVICDLRFLKTLPEKELRNGLAEIVKYGIIKDRGLFSFVDKNLKNMLKADMPSLEHIVFKSCRIKARIVEKDEFDTRDLRAILNFGHTLGHAIEAASRYSKSVTHGRAVASGMVMASFIALELGMLGKGEFEKINSLVKKAVLKKKMKGVRLKGVLSALAYDKKFIRGVNRFILPKRIGAVKIVDNVPEALIKNAVEKCGGLRHG
jgi:3-dehydroquinate synthase